MKVNIILTLYFLSIGFHVQSQEQEQQGNSYIVNVPLKTAIGVGKPVTTARFFQKVKIDEYDLSGEKSSVTLISMTISQF